MRIIAALLTISYIFIATYKWDVLEKKLIATQNYAIEHGYAHHDSVTGEWGWNNE